MHELYTKRTIDYRQTSLGFYYIKFQGQLLYSTTLLTTASVSQCSRRLFGSDEMIITSWCDKYEKCNCLLCEDNNQPDVALFF